MAFPHLEKERPPLPSFALAPDPQKPKASELGESVKCSRFTGQRDDETCATLKLESVPYGERLLLPRGVVLVGDVPKQYLADTEATATPIIRYPYQPLRSVIVDSFWLDVVEVQRRAYQGCVAQGVCTPPQCPEGESEIPSFYSEKAKAMQERLPQTCISYQQAQTYCEHVDGRLPTREEWTYGARGTENWRYSWGAQYRDEMSSKPIAVDQNDDRSYFGLIGMGSGAMELVAKALTLDEGLQPDLRRSFRSYKGPYRSALKEWRRRFACKGVARSACLDQAKAAQRWAMGISVGKGRELWDTKPLDATLEKGLDGSAIMTLPSERVGFRCAYDRKEGEPLLRVPAEIPLAPKELLGDGLRLYVGAAEAVSYEEAERFCAALKVAKSDRQGPRYTRWRLPTWEDLPKLSRLRFGPGPLWLDGGIAAQGQSGSEQEGEGQEKAEVIRWNKLEVPKEQGILARCVRDEAL